MASIRLPIVLSLLWLLAVCSASAQESSEGVPDLDAAQPAPTATEPAAPPSRETELALKQSNLADKYARLEKLLFDLAALEDAENPARAALLRRAYQQSADQLTKKQMDTVSQLLARAELKRAMDEQQEVTKDLKALLDLLLSEDRPERLKNEQERIREYIREVERILRKQIDLHGQNEGGADPQRLANEQGSLSERTEGLADKIREDEGQHESEQGDDGEQQSDDEKSDDEQKPDDGQSPEDQKPTDGDAKPNDGQSGGSEQQPGDQKPNEQEPGEKEPSEKEPSEQQNEDQESGEQEDQQEKSDDQTEPKPSEGSPMPGQPSDQQPSDGRPSDQQQQQQQQQQPGDMPPQEGDQQNSDQQQQQQQQPSSEHPAVERLKEAYRLMREAQQRLEEAKREEAAEEQEKAEAELEKLKAELEQILRQLREEEVGRMLELLESRFRKMLEMELRVYESTKRLDRIPEAERSRDFAIQANNVSADQRKIALEADKALVLLEEEGSSVSFPEAVEQLRDEMHLVSERLAALKTGFVTQESEEAIIAELEELIAALQKAQQEQDRRQQNQQQQQPGEPGEQPLVDELAELKMIRALQMRVNTRTQRFARLLADLEDPVGQVTDEELREHIQQLAKRENRIHELTRDLILGKTE